MRRRKNKNVYAFIDSQNLNVSVQKFGWKVNWQKFRQFLADKYGVTQAFMFIGYIPENEDMYQQLHDSGYSVVLKPTFDMTKPIHEEAENGDKNGKHEEERHIKGNVDADMVLWAMKEIPNYGKAIIVSGDGDFFSLVEYLDQQGKLLKILTPTSHYSGLFNKYEQYIEKLDTYRNELAYHDRRKHFNKNNRQNRA